MKTVMNFLVLFLVTISLAACEKANNPTAPVPADKTALSNNGTFEVTFKDYKNANRTVTVSGDIDFNFNSDKTYSYEATVLNTSDNETASTFHDSGTYIIKGTQIQLFDNATKMMNPAWQPSLYLSGTYSYRKGDNETVIEGTGDYGSVRIVFTNR